MRRLLAQVAGIEALRQGVEVVLIDRSHQSLDQGRRAELRPCLHRVLLRSRRPRRASALPLIERIAVPTLILTARDDPFIAAEPFAEFSPPPGVEVHVARHGGHLGFLGWDGAGGIRWGERRVVEWVLRP